jgi:hypothetical protein
MNKELERIWKEQEPNLRYCPDIYRELLGKSTKKLNQDCQCPSRDSKQAPREYKYGVSPLDQPAR